MVRILLSGFVFIIFLAVLIVWNHLIDGQKISDLSKKVVPSPALFGSRHEVAVTFYGVGTLLFDDSETQIMIDGFFSRPSAATLFLGRKFEPDIDRLQEVVREEKLTRLAAVIPAHSHHDHAMDSAPLAALTGAELLASHSTANIARGFGLPERQISMAEPGHVYRYGKFRITLIESRHGDVPKFLEKVIRLGERIEAPIKQPAKLSDYAEGTTFAILVEHSDASFLVNSSAGYRPNALDTFSADVVFLGVAGLSRKSDKFIEDYLAQTVFAVSAKTVVPVHWDAITSPASNLTLPKTFDDSAYTLNIIEAAIEPKDVSLVAILPKLIE